MLVVVTAAGLRVNPRDRGLRRAHAQEHAHAHEHAHARARTRTKRRTRREQTQRNMLYSNCAMRARNCVFLHGPRLCCPPSVPSRAHLVYAHPVYHAHLVHVHLVHAHLFHPHAVRTGHFELDRYTCTTAPRLLCLC